jgi:AAA15 family ATPase/GTPase
MLNIIEFTVGNYLSFRDKKTFSMEATGIKELPDNVTERGKYRLLRSAVIYGANASGKSNLIKALAFVRQTVLSSSKINSTDKLNVSPFLLDQQMKGQPSYFEILLLNNDERYRYGFELDNSQIHSEWLYMIPIGASKEKVLFVREKDGIALSYDFPEGKGLEARTRDNGLFLSVCDHFNGNISMQLMSSFKNIYILSGIDHTNLDIVTLAFWEQEEKQTKKFFLNLQLGFTDINLVEGPYKYIEKPITTHNVYDETGTVTGKETFKMVECESSGTNKLYDIAGYILMSLKIGMVLIVDELDAKLHPLLTKRIIEMFNSSETNPKGAQLIFATHDTNLLGSHIFRRDQIWFTEKDKMERTDLYSLVEFKEPDGAKVRNDRNYEKDYIAGRYGAIPFLGDFSNLIKDGTNNEN